MYRNKRIYKRTFKPKARTAKDLQQDKKIAKLTKQIKTTAIEQKYVVGTQASTVLVKTTPHIRCINAVAQGTNQTTRSGVKMTMKKLHINFIFTGNNNQFNMAQNYRIVVFSFKPALGLVPTTVQYYGTTSDILPHFCPAYDRDFKNRFKVHYSKMFNLWNNALACRTHELKLKMSFVTDYSRSNNGDYSDIDKNSLYVMLISDKSSTDSQQIYFTYDYVLFCEDN